ncbi:MAG: DUF4468 domain-containing protein [Cyclobacteriaceae bacterium]|nr:DUF4468 domain-containing protein [Cyclobacteriaceae bacterium]
MTTKFVIVTFLAAHTLVAQMPKDEETGLYIYQEVVELTGITQNDLYTRARKWFVNNYKSANAVLDMDDREAGMLIGKGYFEVRFQGGQRKVYHQVQLEVKEGRYRFTINKFNLKFSEVYGEQPFETLTNKHFWGIDKLFQATHNETLLMIESLKKGMAKSADDW